MAVPMNHERRAQIESLIEEGSQATVAELAAAVQELLEANRILRAKVGRLSAVLNVRDASVYETESHRFRVRYTGQDGERQRTGHFDTRDEAEAWIATRRRRMGGKS
jgi:hypothetical protein